MNIESNNKNFQESKSNFTFDFKGKSEIDVLTLSTTMTNVLEILRIVTVKIEPEAYIKVNISSVGKGSIHFDLSAVVGAPLNLFINQIVDVADKVVEGLLAIFLIKKHLEGSMPLIIDYRGDKAVIKNYKNEQITQPKEITETYFSNYKIDNSIVNVFNSLNGDVNRENLVIQKDDINKLEINKSEFPNMSKEIIEPQGNITTKKDKIRTDLYIKNIDFGDKKWEFWFMGRRIEAKIRDEEWKQKVNNGEIGEFTSGDRLPVELVAEYNLDDNGNVIEGTEKFEVAKITGDIIKNPKQIEF